MRPKSRAREGYSALNDQLVAVRGRGLDKIDMHSGSLVPLTAIEDLERLASAYTTDVVNLKRGQRIEALIRAAYALMADSDHKRRIGLIFGLHLVSYDSAASLRELAMVELGEKYLDPHTWVARDRQAFKSLEVAITAVVRQKLAQLRELGFATPYIRRISYHDRVDRLIVEEGHNLIALVGEPGDGKSRLAHGIVSARIRQGETRVNLQASFELNLMSRLKAELADHGIQTLSSTPEELVPAFAALLCSPSAPTYVIIDNLENPDVLSALVLSNARSIVIVTSREDLLPAGRGYAVEVEPMTDDEAYQLGRSLLSNHDEGSIKKLVKTLGNRPLAIEHACVGLIVPGMTVNQFCDGFLSRPAQIMRHAKTSRSTDPYEQSMTWMYEQILSRVRQRDQDNGTKAAILLELIAFLDSAGIPLELLEEALREASPPDDLAMAAVEVISARRELTRLHLIEMQEDGVLAVHQFTHAILQDILRSKKVEICLPLFRLISSKIGDGTTRLTDLHAAGWTQHGCVALQHLVEVDQPELSRGEVQELAVAFSRKFRPFLSLGERMTLLALHVDPEYVDHRRAGVEPSATILMPTEYVKDAALEEIIEGMYGTGKLPHKIYRDMQQAKHDSAFQGVPTDVLDHDTAYLASLTRLATLDGKFDDAEPLRERLQQLAQHAPLDDHLFGAWLAIAQLFDRRAEWESSFRLLAELILFMAEQSDAMSKPQLYSDRIIDILTIRLDSEIEVGQPELVLPVVEAIFEFGGGIQRNETAVSIPFNMNYLDWATFASIYGRALTSIVIRSGSLVDGADLVKPLLMAAGVIFKRAGSYREFVRVAHDFSVYNLIAGQDVDLARQYFWTDMRQAAWVQESVLALSCFLALVKLRAIDGTCTLRDLARCGRIAKRYANLQMPNGEADALGTAYVIAVLCSASTQQIGQAHSLAAAAYAAIDKTAKWERLAKAGTGEFESQCLFLP